MKMKDVLLLCGDTTRTKAYVQAMMKADCLPCRALVMTEEPSSMMKQRDCGGPWKEDAPYFDADVSLLRLLDVAHIPYDFLQTKNVNDDAVAEALRQAPESYVVYSGYGGYILKPHLFAMGKKFLHVHAGMLPRYRGSTTAYYSILQEGNIAATAIFLEEKLDAGAILCTDTFPLPPADVNIDYIYEPYARAQVLVRALQKYIAEGIFSPQQQPQETSETYYIIHPVLKHLAMLKVVQGGEHA